MHKICFTINLFYASTCFEHYVLIVRRSKLYYTSSGIVTPVGGRLVHRLREDSSLNLCTAFTNACHLSLSWASPIQSIPPHPISWRSSLILSSHLRLDLPSGLFPSDFPTKTLYKPLVSPIRSTCPAHLILLDFITRATLVEQYRTLSSSLCSFLHYPFTSSLLDPNILLNTLFSNTLSLV